MVRLLAMQQALKGAGRRSSRPTPKVLVVVFPNALPFGLNTFACFQLGIKKAARRSDGR